jgi:ribosomal protein S12 methylthiotransferase
MPEKVHIVTLGCSKNQVDSEKLLQKISNGGLKVRHGMGRQADTLIINTCGFVGDAKEESLQAILQAIEARKKGKVKKIVVMGCLAQRYKDELMHDIPEVDAWFGVNEEAEIARWLALPCYGPRFEGRKLSTPSHYAYLKIAEGCSRQCSFCAIPGIRGKHVSRHPDEILEEAKWLAAKGVKELLLISQDLTYYGMDTFRKPMITELVKQLSDAGLFHWIRLHYLFPAAFPPDLADLIAERRNICPYIDIPLQHISDRILKSMKRGASKEETIRLLERFREKLPHAAIRTSFIVGYPGETETEFNELLDFIRDVRFERVGVFTYSEEDGTPAARLKDDVPEEVKKQRAARLMELQADISLEKNQALVSKTLEIIIDRKEKEWFIGRTIFDSPEVDNEVLIPASDHSFKPGDLVRMTVNKAGLYEIYGTPCD